MVNLTNVGAVVHNRGEQSCARRGVVMRKIRNRFKTKVAVLAIAAFMVIAGGAAFAYWTNTGSGTGTATTGTNVGITVNQTSTISAMYPGQGAVTLAGDFTNTNAGPTYVAAVTATGYTIDAAHVSAGCTVIQGNYTLGGTATVGHNVASGTNVDAWTGLTITMNNLATNQDLCKGAVLTITYASS